MRTTLVLMLAVVSSACASYQPNGSSAPYGEPVADEIVASLFPGDAELLSDAQIGEILRASPGMPIPASVAIVHLQHESAVRSWGYGSFWAALQPGTRHELAETVGSALVESGSVSRAEALPIFLLPEQPSVAHLREAAARFRTDAVFLYRSDCQAYQRYRFFGSSEVKAFCSVEAALLDTRTGIVPFTATSLRDFTVKKSDEDANMLETVRRAETEALEAALSRVGSEIGARMRAGPG